MSQLSAALAMLLPRRKPRKPIRTRLRVEEFEAKVLPDTRTISVTALTEAALRAAILEANKLTGNDDATLDLTKLRGRLELTQALPTMTRVKNVFGPGPTNLQIVRKAGIADQFRIFDLKENRPVTIKDLYLGNGTAAASSRAGRSPSWPGRGRSTVTSAVRASRPAWAWIRGAWGVAWVSVRMAVASVAGLGEHRWPCVPPPTGPDLPDT